MRKEPPSKPVTLIEVLVVLTILLTVSEVMIGFPSSWFHEQTAKNIKKSYLQNIKSQGLTIPVDPKTLHFGRGCGFSPNPLTTIWVKSVTGETFLYRVTTLSERHWWTKDYHFQIDDIIPAYTNLPQTAQAPRPPASLTITNEFSVTPIPFANLVPLELPLEN